MVIVPSKAPLGLLVLIILFSVYACYPSTEAKELSFSRWADIEEAKNFQILIDQYNSQDPGPAYPIQSDYLPWTAYWEKLEIARQIGGLPDVFLISHENLNTWIVEEALEPLTDDAMAYLDGAFADFLWKEATLDGRQWAIPVGLSIPIFIYNRQLLEVAQVPFPSQGNPMMWEEFVDLLRPLLLKDAEGKVIQYPLLMPLDELAQNLLASYGSPLFHDPGAQKTPGFDPAKATRALGLLASMYAEGLIPPSDADTVALGFGTSSTALLTGRVAFMYTSSNSLPPVIEAGVRFGTMPQPMATFRTPGASVHYLAVSPWSKNFKAAWNFALWMAVEAQGSYGVSGDFPAHNLYNEPVTRTATPYRTALVPSYVYRTLASEKPHLTPFLEIRDPTLRQAWESILGELSMGRLSPALAANAIQTALDTYMETQP